MPGTSEASDEARSSEIRKAPRRFDPEDLFGLLKNAIFDLPQYNFDSAKSRKILARLPFQVSPETEINLMEDVRRAVSLYYSIKDKQELLRWTKERAAPLRGAQKAAGQLVKFLNKVDIGVQQWCRYPTFSGTDFSTLLKASVELRDNLDKIALSLPEYTPPRQTNYHHLVLIEGLLGAWENVTQQPASRSKKAGGFLSFALAVSEEGKVGLTWDQLDTSLRKVRARRNRMRNRSCG